MLHAVMQSVTASHQGRTNMQTAYWLQGCISSLAGISFVERLHCTTPFLDTTQHVEQASQQSIAVNAWLIHPAAVEAVRIPSWCLLQTPAEFSHVCGADRHSRNKSKAEVDRLLSAAQAPGRVGTMQLPG